ncbi:hypothetical protein K2Z83_02020 [Oscillochloris sp. ZM17-4]|uniref:hypothetical protein n=1 Tax=Oscillochloris sp. ZM17-4 TaxID=2866714 RepID=UPI001C72F50F|nr:hypothetical protein [Oscillochloris sp. ZM17-4]MBX0326471.1 hypothetical protein [Oscillochloris sp. ZM17-4]
MPARRPQRAPGILPVALGLLALVIVVAGLAVALGGAPAPSVASRPEAVDTCRATPQFVAAVATSPDVALATDGREMGLALRSATGEASAYQHPTWDDAGYLGAIAYDAQGNVYAAPTPRLSLADNPLAGAATIWRADTASGELHPFVTLPGAASARNPFGVLGLFYACGLDTLYAGSVLGSTPAQEQGGVIAMHLPDGGQTTILSDTDVMGVLLVRQGAGYTMYAGLARRPEVVALPLDAQGRAAGPPVQLLDLTAAGATPQERARKLRLVGDDLVIDLVPFTFSLQANATDVPQVRRAVWGWDAATGKWSLRQAAQSMG